MCLVRILSRSGVNKDCYNYHFALPKFFFRFFIHITFLKEIKLYLLAKLGNNIAGNSTLCIK